MSIKQKRIRELKRIIRRLEREDKRLEERALAHAWAELDFVMDENGRVTR